MSLLVKYLKKFLFCEDLSIIKELKEIYKENSEEISFENLTYYEILQEKLIKPKNFSKNSERKIPNKNHEIKENYEEKFEKQINDLKKENQSLKEENMRIKGILEEIKLELEKTKEIIKEIRVKEDEENLFSKTLKESLDYKIDILKLKEVFSL